MASSQDLLTIGQVGFRADMAASALRFYEQQGLIQSVRSSSGKRMFHREVLRRLAFIQAAQRVGLSLGEIKETLAGLPDERTPNLKDWEKLSAKWRDTLNARIDMLEHLRDDLTSCIGCGCLSLKSCALYNADDVAYELGSGARYLLGNKPGDQPKVRGRRVFFD